MQGAHARSTCALAPPTRQLLKSQLATQYTLHQILTVDLTSPDTVPAKAEPREAHAPLLHPHTAIDTAAMHTARDTRAPLTRHDSTYAAEGTHSSAPGSVEREAERERESWSGVQGVLGSSLAHAPPSSLLTAGVPPTSDTAAGVRGNLQRVRVRTSAAASEGGASSVGGVGVRLVREKAMQRAVSRFKTPREPGVETSSAPRAGVASGGLSLSYAGKSEFAPASGLACIWSRTHTEDVLYLCNLHIPIYTYMYEYVWCSCHKHI